MEASDGMIRWNHSMEALLLLLLLLEPGEEVEKTVLFWVAIPFLISKPKKDPEQCVVTNRAVQALRCT